MEKNMSNGYRPVRDVSPANDELARDIREFVVDLTANNTTVLNKTGHPVSHPDNQYPPLDVLQAYFGSPIYWVKD